MMPDKFRKQQVEVEAMRWEGGAANATPIIDWILENGGTARYHSDEILGDDSQGDPIVLREHLQIDTFEGTMRANVGDWIIRGVRGEFYPCKPDIFEQTYTPVPDKPRPLLMEDELVAVPVRAVAQEAFEKWLRDEERQRSLGEVLAPFGLDLNRNVTMPVLYRMVFEGESRVLKAEG